MSDDIQFRMERAKLIERARLELHWTKRQLAEKAGYDEKTLYTLLSGGDVQSKTVFDICQALGIEPPVQSQKKIEVADEKFGAYSRSIYTEYEGRYFIYRPSFLKPDQIYRYVMDIAWDEVDSLFRFMTFYKADVKEPGGAKTHGGPVYISALTNLVHFVVTFRGSVRLVTVSKLRQADGIMRGSTSTHIEDLNFFRPTLSPIVIRKFSEPQETSEFLGSIGLLTDGDGDRAFAREQLDLTESRVLNLCFQSRA